MHKHLVDNYLEDESKERYRNKLNHLKLLK